jgi:hypothetical protein
MGKLGVVRICCIPHVFNLEYAGGKRNARLGKGESYRVVGQMRAKNPRFVSGNRHQTNLAMMAPSAGMNMNHAASAISDAARVGQNGSAAAARATGLK